MYSGNALLIVFIYIILITVCIFEYTTIATAKIDTLYKLGTVLTFFSLTAIPGFYKDKILMLILRLVILGGIMTLISSIRKLKKYRTRIWYLNVISSLAVIAGSIGLIYKYKEIKKFL